MIISHRTRENQWKIFFDRKEAPICISMIFKTYYVTIALRAENFIVKFRENSFTLFLIRLLFLLDFFAFFLDKKESINTHQLYFRMKSRNK